MNCKYSVGRKCLLGAAFVLSAGWLSVHASAADGGPLLLDHAATSREAQTSPKSHIRVGVNLTLVPVTVTDSMGRTVTGLERANFRVFDQGKEQQILSFSSEDVPVSVGLVFDLSGSMKDKLSEARNAVRAFARTLNPADEMFLVTFASRPRIAAGFTNSVGNILSSLMMEKADGRTSLVDAVYLALHHIHSAAHNGRKALLIVSDGGDNSSRYTLRELKSYAVEADTQIYAIGIHDDVARTWEELMGKFLLVDIASATGGAKFTVENLADLSDIASKIGVYVHNEYVLGYRPPENLRPGKYRKVHVELHPPRGVPPLSVYARQGYYAPPF